MAIKAKPINQQKHLHQLQLDFDLKSLLLQLRLPCFSLLSVRHHRCVAVCSAVFLDFLWNPLLGFPDLKLHARDPELQELPDSKCLAAEPKLRLAKLTAKLRQWMRVVSVPQMFQLNAFKMLKATAPWIKLLKTMVHGMVDSLC